MKIESSPITGNEDKQNLTAPLRALSDFYTAFNNAVLELMSKNWAQTDEVITDNPVGGIKRGWEKIDWFMTRYFRGPQKFKWNFTTTRCTRQKTSSTSLAESVINCDQVGPKLIWRSARIEFFGL